MFRSPWGFDQTTEIRFGSPKFDCSLASNECFSDGCMDLLAQWVEWFQNQDHQHPLVPRGNHVFTLPWRSLCTALCLPITLQHPPEYKPILLGIFGEFLVERIGKSQDLVSCCSGIYWSVDLLETRMGKLQLVLTCPSASSNESCGGKCLAQKISQGT